MNHEMEIKELKAILKEALECDEFNDHSSGRWQIKARKLLGLPDPENE